MQLPVALLIIGALAVSGTSQFVVGDWTERLLLMGSAPATLLPVGLFCYGMMRTRMSTVGLLQYIEPSLAFLLAIFWFGETPDPVKSVGFAFVWAGLLVSLLPLHKLVSSAPQCRRSGSAAVGLQDGVPLGIPVHLLGDVIQPAVQCAAGFWQQNVAGIAGLGKGRENSLPSKAGSWVKKVSAEPGTRVTSMRPRTSRLKLVLTFLASTRTRSPLAAASSMP